VDITLAAAVAVTKTILVAVRCLLVEQVVVVLVDMA
jgi:hypothetical protein